MKNEKLEESKMENGGPPDYYKNTLEREEEESRERSEQEDQEVFVSIAKDIRQLLKEIYKLKTDKPDKFMAEIEDRRVKILLLMVTLRKLSRVQKLRVKNGREASIESRQGVDTVTLRLQNLLYEISHLKKEVKRCLDFQSADQEVDLIPIDQFYNEAPESISRPAETKDNKHQQRLAQLHWELEQRRGQTQLFDKLTQEKERIAAIISDQEAKLASLGPKINNILEAAAPLQTALNFPLTTQKEQQQMSQFLPAPLYTLFVQASAYKDSGDKQLSVVIEGDVEAAKKLTNAEEVETDGSDSEPENEPLDESHSQKSRSRNGKSSENDERSDELKQLLKLHPLHVIMTISTNNDSVTIDFAYAVNLKIVTTKCSIDVSSKYILTDGDVLSKDNLLVLLFPNDSGSCSPNPSNAFQLMPFKDRLPSNYFQTLGTPYKWAQTLAGISFLPEKKPEDSEEGKNLDCVSWRKSAEHMGNIIKAIRRRLKARLLLQEQFANLQTSSTLLDIPVAVDVLREHFPTKISSDLKSWQSIKWEDYAATPQTQSLIQANIVDQDSLTFKAVLERNNVCLEALVAVSLDYPNSAPIFALSLEWNGQKETLASTYLKDIEKEVNIFWTELASNRDQKLRLLSLQLYRLAMCLDVLTEGISIQLQENSPEPNFHKEKIFFRAARGRERALPFKYLSKLSVFAHR